MMETTLESLVDVFLTRCGSVFTTSQYEVVHDPASLDGGSSIDIVALDYSRSPKEVVIVEVSMSANLASLFSKIEERDRRWFRPLKRQLIEAGVIDETWSLRFLGFIRDTNLVHARGRFRDSHDVAFHPIEEAMLPYEYWDDRLAMGLPR